MSLRDLTPWRKHRNDVSANPLSPYGSLQEEINQFFNDIAPKFTSLTPAEYGNDFNLAPVNIIETDQTLEVTADMPGIAEEDLDIKLKDNVLTLKGERKEEKEDKRSDYHCIERSSGTFLRRIALPADVDENDVHAEFSNGVLKVILPKSPDANSRTRRIPISSS